MMRGMLCAAFLISHFSFLICPVTAQGLLTEIKVIAIHYAKDLDEHAQGYEGGDGKDKLERDFRKGKGGGYVFTLFKRGTDKQNYITDVIVETKDAYGVPFKHNGNSYTPAHFYQETGEHYKEDYKGGLNGRNYGAYGGAYTGQPHIYVTRTGNGDFSKKVLKSAEVLTTKPKSIPSDATLSGPHAGGGRYLLFHWHTHQPKFRPLPTHDITTHERYCDLDQCGITMKEPHRFPQFYGHDEWSQIPETDKVGDKRKSHYKKCIDCGQIIYEAHKWATFVSDKENHTKQCLTCDYIEEADHENFGKDQIPVDEYYHMIYCGDCGFLKKVSHDFGDSRFEMKKDCEHVVVEYRCKQCYHQAYFEEPGLGHDYNAYGICTRNKCMHPFQQPEKEKLASDSDSVYVVKNYGHLFWIADYVNNRRPNTHVRLANDLTADSLIQVPWIPIGKTDSTAFQGTFDGAGHVISMLQTEKPVAGIGYRGLFGAIGKNATVKNLTVAGCHMRGWNNIGAVAGVNNGTIEDCHVVFSLMSSIGSGMNIGGICGLNRGTISRSTTESNVWVGGVRDYAGGICGTNDGGTLSGNVSQAVCGSGSDAALPETASQQ